MPNEHNVAAERTRLRFSDLYLEEILASIFLLVVVASVSWGVLTRYLLATPANWTGELASICFAWTVFLGAAAAFRRAGHIAIDSFLFLLPIKLARFAQLFAGAVTMITLLTVTVLATRFTISTIGSPMTVLRVPQSVLYGAAATGFALMSFRHAVSTYETLIKKGL